MTGTPSTGGGSRMTYGGCGSGSSRRRRRGTSQKVRSLQKLMLRSRANTLLSVRRVTERNAGRLTAGVDGEVVLTPEAKARLADRIAAPGRAVQGPAGQARVHPQAGQQHQAPTARNSRDRRPVPSGTGRQRAGARVGGAGSSRGPMGFGRAVVAMTRSRPSTRSSRARARSGRGRWTQIWPGRSTASPTTTFWPCSARSPPGEWSRSG